MNLCSGGLLKPRSVHKLYKINILNTLMSRHHCANILLATCALLLICWETVVEFSLGCHDIDWIVTVHGCPSVVH